MSWFFKNSANTLKKHLNNVKFVRLSSCQWRRFSDSYRGVVGNDRGKFERSVGDLFEKWKIEFERNSISEPKESIENILAHCLGTSKLSDVYEFRNQILSDLDIMKIAALCEKRMIKMPIQYVIGEWQFRNLQLKMSPPVFIPRPETETLVDLVLAEIDKRDCKQVLELCCGSGAIALSLLQERDQLKVTALDQSAQACQLIRENAENLNLMERLKIIQFDLNQKCSIPVTETFDIVVSNPPYVPTAAMVDLQPEILLYEDLNALDGGKEGLDLIKLIVEMLASSQILNKGGKLFLEVDNSHPELLKEWIKKSGLKAAYENTYKDFCGKNRYVEVVKT